MLPSPPCVGVTRLGFAPSSKVKLWSVVIVRAEATSAIAIHTNVRAKNVFHPLPGRGFSINRSFAKLIVSPYRNSVIFFMPASSAAMSESQQKYERETIGRWYWGYVRISQKHPRCEGRYFRRTDTNRPKAEDCTQPRVHAFNRLRISTRKGVERSDCSKMTAWILLPSPRVKR